MISHPLAFGAGIEIGLFGFWDINRSNSSWSSKSVNRMMKLQGPKDPDLERPLDILNNEQKRSFTDHILYIK